MNPDKPKTLIYGYGNPGRQDDALGVMLADGIENWSHSQHLPWVHAETNYQLNLEDAEKITHYNRVIFADASQEPLPDGFLFTPLKPSEAIDFSMHAVAPAFILHLCHEVFHHTPEAYLLHIKGYEWEFMKNITGTATDNLNKALDFVKSIILQHSNT